MSIRNTLAITATGLTVWLFLTWVIYAIAGSWISGVYFTLSGLITVRVLWLLIWKNIFYPGQKQSQQLPSSSRPKLSREP